MLEVNIAKLRGKIVEMGFNTERLAKSIGIDKSTLYRKISNGGEDFTIGEMHRICEALSLSPYEAKEIFLP